MEGCQLFDNTKTKLLDPRGRILSRGALAGLFMPFSHNRSIFS